MSVLCLAGCDTTVTPPIPVPPDGPAVYSVVQAWDSTQYAVVTTPRAADQRRLQYVRDATVRIADRQLSVVPEDSLHPGGYIPTSPPGESDANYETDSLYIRPGERVHLRVAEGEHDVTGTVRVPGAFTGFVDSMTVRWHPSAGAQKYKVRIRRYDDRREVVWEFVTTTSDTAVTVDKTGTYGSFRSGRHGITITAVDSNLVQYRGGDVRRSGIKGSFGFFGAITRISGTVSLPATNQQDTHSRSVPDLTPVGRLPKSWGARSVGMR